ncbi:MAG: biotin-dependent carboxyltransferase family protein [Novosphingobium sp.]|uniref:5-oxoprolinase subunit C family protein n=1 Tax=Novosphingobium sp. TaxID=1874826 RepID=UPI003017F3A2
MIALLRIEAAGPLTSVQDAGRRGAMRFGVPRSGPIDRLAFAAALAAAQPECGTAIELSLGGLTLTCLEGEIGFALCGSGFTAEIDGRALGGWCRATLGPGQRLRVRQGVGNWAYLAFAGASVAPAWLGSRATHALSGLGGGMVRSGDVLEFHGTRPLHAAALQAPPEPSLMLPIGVVIGPQERYFAPDALERLCAETFTATGTFDRMGRALEGLPLMPLRLDMPSEPTMRGCLQIAGDGRMTMLMADHQTTGGFPKIASVISADVTRLAQLPPGTTLRFETVSTEEAVRRLHVLAQAQADCLRRLVPVGTLEERLRETNLVGGVIDALGAEVP